jgi:hypothetical protein
MQTKLKALVGAIALVAAGQSFAAVDLASGNSSVLLTVFDVTSKTSATFDLGVQFGDFVGSSALSGLYHTTDPGLGAYATTGHSWDLSTGAYSSVWSSFMSQTAAGDVLQYSLQAGSIGNKGILTTAFSDPTGKDKNQGINGAVLGNNGTTGYFGSVVKHLNDSTISNGSATLEPFASTNPANFGQGGGDRWFGKLATSSLIDLGSTTNLYYGSATSNSALGTAFWTGLNNGVGLSTFSVSSTGVATYAVAAAVPEPQTYAMLLAGFALMGLIARRRV